MSKNNIIKTNNEKTINEEGYFIPKSIVNAGVSGNAMILYGIITDNSIFNTNPIHIELEEVTKILDITASTAKKLFEELASKNFIEVHHCDATFCKCSILDNQHEPQLLYVRKLIATNRKRFLFLTAVMFLVTLLLVGATENIMMGKALTFSEMFFSSITGLSFVIAIVLTAFNSVISTVYAEWLTRKIKKLRDKE